MPPPAPPPPAAARADNLKGAAFMLAGGMWFSIGYGIVKDLAEAVPAAELAFLRHVVGTALFAPLILRRGWRFVATRRPVAQAGRAFFGYTGFLFLILALESLILADAIALSFTSPLWAFAIAVTALGERPGWGRALAALAGFGGVLLIVKPGAGAFQLAALLALASAATSAVAMATVKDLTRTEPPERIAFYFMIWGVLYGAVPAALDWRWPPAGAWPAIVAVGVLSWLGQICLTRGFALGQFTRMAPLDYARIPIAVLIGLVAFGEAPDALSIVGMAVVVASSVYIVVAPAPPLRAAADRAENPPPDPGRTR